MSSIGGNNFDIMQGQPLRWRRRVETWQVPGLDGYGAILLGNGNAESDVKTVKYFATDSEADTAIGAYNTTVGSIQTVIDDWTSTFQQMLVKDVIPAKQACIWNGHAHACRLEATWKLCKTSNT